YLVMGFSAGVLVAAALIDLLPEAIEMVEMHQPAAATENAPIPDMKAINSLINFSTPDAIFLSAMLGFLLYYSLDFFVHLGAAGHFGRPDSPAAADSHHDHHHGHGHHHHGHADHHASPSRFGSVAALGLVVHSLLDGFAIGGASHTDSKTLV